MLLKSINNFKIKIRHGYYFNNLKEILKLEKYNIYR